MLLKLVCKYRAGTEVMVMSTENDILVKNEKYIQPRSTMNSMTGEEIFCFHVERERNVPRL